jgi:spermidine/putrescine transport system substrate-binding protein
MKKTLIRSGIIFFWIALIFGALYWPRWKVMQRFEGKSINIFAWGDILEPTVVADFEKETGIKVNLSYYASNEELIVKLKATRGEGYDLIIPSDYAVDILIKEDLLKELDKKQFAYWDALNPRLTNQFFDPTNKYSIPFEWELFGLGIDTDYFAAHPTASSWGMIFDPNTVHYKIIMKNDPIEAVAFAAFYLYGATDRLDQPQAEAVTQTLIRQKPWVTAYADYRGDYFLATKNVAVVVASSSYIWRTKRLVNFAEFVVPKEGTFITIENVCIPKASNKEELVFRFLNYLYSPKSVRTHFTTYGFFPATLNGADVIDVDPQAAELMNATPEEFQKYHFIRTILPEDEIRDIWVEVKTGEF